MTRRVVLFTVAILAIVIVSTTGLSAHPAASSEVLVTVDGPRSIRLAFITDAEALVAKLEVLEGKTLEGAMPADLAAAVARLATLEADGRPVLLEPAAVTAGPDGPDGRARVSVELVAILPADAASLSFRTRLIFGAYPFVVRHGADGPESFTWVSSTEISAPLALSPPAGTWWQDAAGSIGVGFVHVVPRGLDHILFVLGLFLFAPRLGPVLAQVSVFTLAHSLTLALSTAGLVGLPAGLVEPLIALSIVYIAVENLSSATVTWRRLGLVGLFGLLHGLGFAGALGVLDLGRASMSATLVGFNLGVECGQLAVIAVAACAVGLTRRAGLDAQAIVARPASLVIGLAGLYWVAERTFGS